MSFHKTIDGASMCGENMKLIRQLLSYVTHFLIFLISQVLKFSSVTSLLCTRVLSQFDVVW
jgi:hypothetical protein